MVFTVKQRAAQGRSWHLCRVSNMCCLCVWGQLKTWQQCRGPCQPWGAWLSPRMKARTKETQAGSSSESNAKMRVSSGCQGTKLELPLFLFAEKHKKTSGSLAPSSWRLERMWSVCRWAPIRERARRAWATEDPGRSCRITVPQLPRRTPNPRIPLEALSS